jgi:hypothetical protein
MAIAIDQTTIGGNASTAAAGSLAFTTAAAVAAGGFIVLGVGWFTTGGVVTLSSVSGGGLTWTIDKQGHAANPSGSLSAVVSAQAPAGLASGTTITATFSASTPSDLVIGGCSFTGVATSSPVDATSGPVGVSPAAAGWTTASTALSAGSVLVGVCYTETNPLTSTITAPSQEWLDRPAGTDTALTGGYRIESSAGSYTVAGAWSAAGSSTTNGVAYLAAAGGATPATPVFIPHRMPLGV